MLFAFERVAYTKSAVCQVALSPAAFHNLCQCPAACIIKLITAVIYGFRNKLECLSLASLSSLV
jgi:hypothetical protein